MMKNPLTATTSMCECRRDVRITALFWHLKQSEVTYMSHIDNKNNPWTKGKSHNSIAMKLIQKEKVTLHLLDNIFS